MKLYKIQLFENDVWVDQRWDDGDLFLFNENEIDRMLKMHTDYGEIAKKELHSDNPPDPSRHTLPFGGVINVGEDGLGISSWDCVKAPEGITTCRYNIKEDPACDFCIYCGEPQERF